MSSAATRMAPCKPEQTTAMRKPSMEATTRLGQAAQQLLNEGFDYADAVSLFRVFILSAALKSSKNVKKHAAARLGMSRDHLRTYLDRFKDLLR